MYFFVVNTQTRQTYEEIYVGFWGFYFYYFSLLHVKTIMSSTTIGLKILQMLYAFVVTLKHGNQFSKVR